MRHLLGALCDWREHKEVVVVKGVEKNYFRGKETRCVGGFVVPVR